MDDAIGSCGITLIHRNLSLRRAFGLKRVAAATTCLIGMNVLLSVARAMLGSAYGTYLH
ncbi:hypothetical protein ACL07V_14085 [Streptomyces sp. MB22_4]|uniref:hypothetical protein n=1 Tax=Streptomyces sp. MB22_4 TaxID=3383120 RepID=UPI0039A34CE4